MLRDSTKKLLIVDDYESYVFLLQEQLSEYSFTPLVAYSLKEARAMLEEHRPDVVLLDIELGDGNGIDFLKEVRADYQNTFFVITTGSRDPSNAIEAALLGAAYFIKPIEPYEIRALIEHSDMMLASMGVMLGRQAADRRKTEKLDIERLEETMSILERLKLSAGIVIVAVCLAVVLTIYIQSLVGEIF